MIAVQALTPEDLFACIGGPLGATIEESRKLVAWVTQRGHDDHVGVVQVRARVRDRVAEFATVGRLEVLERHASAEDPFVKFVLRCNDGALIEAVRIPLEKRGRFVVCVSSQVGCAMGCTFCATGRMGFMRNLETWEIIEQIRIIANELRATGEGRVHGVVFQGMGEPLHNLDNVIGALRVISNPCGLGIDGRNVTVCTVGIVPGIERLTEIHTRARLAISVTSARPWVRRSLIPMEAKYPIQEVIEAARKYYEKTGRLVMLAYTLLSGVNTDRGEALALSELLKIMPARLSLIDWNPVEGTCFKTPGDQEREDFHDALATLGVPVVRRYSGGKDIDAACGQLATGSTRRRGTA